MKKFISTFLALATLSFSSCNPILAGGINKEEILSDGTKLIYISTDKIPSVAQEYRKRVLELENQRYSMTKDLTIKGLSLASTKIGFSLLSHLEDSHPKLGLLGKIFSSILGAIGFFYPDYHDHNFAIEHGDYYDSKPYIFEWGPEYNNQGAKTILRQLNSYCSNFHPGLIDEDIESGAVIVIRPKSKLYAEGDFNSRCFESRVYSQLEMESNDRNNFRGYRWVLIENDIPNGR